MNSNLRPHHTNPDMTQHIISWIKDTDCTHAVTLTFNKEISYERAKKLLSQFALHIDKKLLGRRAHRAKSSERTFFIAFPEHLDSNIHFHLALRLPPSYSKKEADEWLENGGKRHLEYIWGKLTQFSGNVVIKEIYDHVWAEYITKDVKWLQRIHPDAGYILSSDFHNDEMLKKRHH